MEVSHGQRVLCTIIPMTQPPPNDIDAEAACIACCLLSSDAVADVTSVVKSGDFYSGSHAEIFKAIEHLTSSSTDVDLITVSSRLRETGMLASVGGNGYLTEILGSSFSIAKAATYASIVRDKSVLRAIQLACHKGVADGYQWAGSPEEYLSSVEDALGSTAARGTAGGLVHIVEPVKKAYKSFQEHVESGRSIKGIPTGIYTLDKVLGGCVPGRLTVLAARPGVGKTALSVCISRSVAETGAAVAFFSLEMLGEELAQRSLAIESGLELQFISAPDDVTQRKFDALAAACVKLSKLPIYIDDQSGIGMPQIRARAKRLASKLGRDGKKLGLVVIDYLQIMRTDADSREREIAIVTGECKGLAKQLGCQVLLLSQLNRGPQGTTEYTEPTISRLKDSSGIEQDADSIVFIHKNEDGDRKLLVRKNRHGPGEVDIPIKWNGELTRFTEDGDG